MIIASFEYEFNSKKSKLLNPYMVELTVFIKVKIPSLKELSKLIPNIGKLLVSYRELIDNKDKFIPIINFVGNIKFDDTSRNN